MKTSTLFAALCTAAAALCAMSAEAQTAPAAPQAAAAPAPGTPWSLDDCIGYALANNIDVQQRALQVEQNEVELSTAKYSRLPDLNASIGGDASFGRVLSSDNTYKDNNQTSGSLNISTSLPVFQGMRINRQVKGGKLDLAAAMQDLERAREDVSINVMTLYLEVLYNKELTDVAERQLALSTLQATQSRELVAAGKQPESARYESEALMAKDQLSLTQARNDLQLALLNLSQALNRESAAGFDVVVPELDSVTLASLHRLGTADGVYNYAVENRPHIKAERLRLESSENSVLIAKSALYPSISLSGGYGTGVYSADSDKFWAQMRHNSREYVGLSMNIPIFNRRATRNNIRSAQLSARSQRLPRADRSRAGAAQGDRTGVVQRRRGVQQIPFGRRSPRLGRGSVRLRTAEGGIGPFDHFRFQRCQDPHGKSRVGTRSGEIRIRIPFENTGFLPRETAETVIRAGKQIVHNKQIRAADIDRPDAVRNNQSLKFSGSDRVRFSDSHPAQKPFCVTNYPLHPLCEVG